MISAESSAEIARPVEEVFAFVADVGNESKWHTDVVSARLDPPGPPAQGKVLHGRFRTLGRTRDGVADVIGFDPARSITYAFRAPTFGLRPILTYTFQPKGAGTRFTRRIDAETNGPAGILFTFMKPILARRTAACVQKLKRAIEQSG